MVATVQLPKLYTGHIRLCVCEVTHQGKSPVQMGHLCRWLTWE